MSHCWIHCPECCQEWTVDYSCTAPGLLKCDECGIKAKNGRTPIEFDDENIYGLASIRQSIEEDRK